jgi:hypothetical protein
VFLYFQGSTRTGIQKIQTTMETSGSLHEPVYTTDVFCPSRNGHYGLSPSIAGLSPARHEPHSICSIPSSYARGRTSESRDIFRKIKFGDQFLEMMKVGDRSFYLFVTMVLNVLCLRGVSKKLCISLCF